MIENALKIAVAGLCLASANPSSAEELSAPASEAEKLDPATAPAGYRIVAAAGGFQLVTHGVWDGPSSAIEPSHPELTPAHIAVARATENRPRAGDASRFRRAAYLPQVYAVESRNNIPAGLLDALVWTESRYNPLAVSRVGAAGLGQLMPGTARELGVSNRFDPIANLSGAARYLRQMLDRFGLVHLAVAAYNAGPGAVERAGGIPRNGETPAYVSNVLSFWGFK